MADGARAQAIGDRRGRLKALVDSSNGEILGFHILAPHADDLLHEAVIKFKKGMLASATLAVPILPLPVIVRGTLRSAEGARSRRITRWYHQRT